MDQILSYELTLVSGADHKFFRSLWQFCKSVIRHRIHRDNRIILYDLGLLPRQRRLLDQTVSPFAHFEVRAFPAEHYPAFVHVRAGTYAWKPVIVSNVLEEVKGPVLWLDSATIILNGLHPVAEALDRFGVYVPISGSGTLKKWIHPQTLAYLRVPPEFLHKRNRAGGVCGFHYRNPAVRQLVDQWRRLALIKECIAPEGATVKNHRFDQALLTILLYQYQDACGLWLTSDEVDISSVHPVSFLSVGNKISNRIPLYLDGPVRWYFMARRHLDILTLKIRASLS